MKKLSEFTDEELALAYANGDNKAFDLLLSRNQTKLFSYILFVVRDREKAEDIFQETFVKVISRLQQQRYVTSGKFGAWLIRIAHNIIMDSYRERRIENVIETPEDNNLTNISSDNLLELNIENQYVICDIFKDIIQNIVTALTHKLQELKEKSISIIIPQLEKTQVDNSKIILGEFDNYQIILEKK